MTREEEILEQEPCQDCISREAVMKLLEKEDWADTVYGVMNLPSTRQERKKGKWVKMTGMMPPEYFGHYECSECGWHLSHHDKTKENELEFCPNCGAKMEVRI